MWSTSAAILRTHPPISYSNPIARSVLFLISLSEINTRYTGDITNLVGCILTHQLPFQTYLASYFVFVDMSLVAQYIYYYKPPLPPSPDYSPTSSRSASLAMTMTPTAVVYSPRNLTRPSSRTPLLVGEVEAGYRTYDKRARSLTGSSRFSGVMSSYPPTGLLPSSEEVEGKGKAKRQSSKPSISSLRRYAEKNAHEDRVYHNLEDGGEGDDELSAMTESFHSDISAPAGDGRGIKRHISWSRAVSESALDDTTGDNTPRQGIVTHPALIRNPDSIASTSSATPVASHEQPHTGTLEELRKRSRSRGRASRRNRPSPLLVYELASPTGLIPTAGTTTSGFDRDGNPLSAQQLLHLEVAAQRERDSKSGSRRRRSASIVFLSVGIGALLAFGGGETSASSGISAMPNGVTHGRVLGADVPSVVWEQVPQASALIDDFVPIYSSSDPGPEETRSRRRPRETPPLTREQKRRLIGRISAWACTTLYLTSRLPQIWKNVSLFCFILKIDADDFLVHAQVGTRIVVSVIRICLSWEYILCRQYSQPSYFMGISTTRRRT